MRLLGVMIVGLMGGMLMCARTMVAEKIKCSPEQVTKMEDDSTRVRSWALLHKMFVVYRACAPDDGVIVQGASHSVARLLVDSWSKLPEGAQLMQKDAEFRKFVLAGINATVADDDLKTIKEKSEQACPAGGQGLCAEIEQAADEALKAGTSPE